MPDPWPIRFVVDAFGAEDALVRVRRVHPDAPAHLTVRVGALTVFVLDGPAVTAIAGAWARAHASSADLLPVTSRPPRPLATDGGYAAPAAQVVADGPTRWDVLPPREGHRYTTVASSWLQVRVHDAAALLTHTRVWAQAADLGQTVLATPPTPFRRLLESATSAELVERFRAGQPPRPLSR